MNFLAPALPYLQIRDIELLGQGALGPNFPPAPLSIKPFGVLVATGVYVGAYLMVRQARRVGLPEKKFTSFMGWNLAMGFIVAHMFDAVFYYPDKVARDPMMVFRMWEGLSSFGGFLGALLGSWIWRWRHREPFMPYADVVASAFPVGWVFGRAGCSIAHDHPGFQSDAWYAVAYPSGGRLDLGLYEMLLTIPLALAFPVLWRKPRPWGFFLGLMCIAYAPMRFALDFLRSRDLNISDQRYLDLTPAQWACIAMLIAGSVVFGRAMANAGQPESVAPPFEGTVRGRKVRLSPDSRS